MILAVFTLRRPAYDTGYLEFLRIIGVFAILLNGFLIVISLLAYATAVPAAYHPANTQAGNPYAAPTTAGTYNTGAAAYANPNAGPGFVTQQAPMNTNTTVAQPTYTTTTAPTSTYTTTTGPTTTHL